MSLKSVKTTSYTAINATLSTVSTVATVVETSLSELEKLILETSELREETQEDRRSNKLLAIRQDLASEREAQTANFLKSLAKSRKDKMKALESFTEEEIEELKDLL